MAALMLQFHHPGSAPTLHEVRELFGLSATDLDSDFGIIATDPAAALYTVMVDAAAAGRVRQRLASRPPHPAEALFANVAIEPTSNDGEAD